MWYFIFVAHRVVPPHTQIYLFLLWHDMAFFALNTDQPTHLLAVLLCWCHGGVDCHSSVVHDCCLLLVCCVLSVNTAAIALSLEESGKQTKSLYPSVSNTVSASLQQRELRKVLVVRWHLLITLLATVLQQSWMFIGVTVLCNTYSTCTAYSYHYFSKYIELF